MNEEKLKAALLEIANMCRTRPRVTTSAEDHDELFGETPDDAFDWGVMAGHWEAACIAMTVLDIPFLDEDT